MNRLADSIMLLPDEPGIQEALKRMAHSVMQPGARSLSQGKDALWEIALLADLRKTGMPARAAEPDIMVALGMVDYPIACKKIWSEANVTGQIKKGTRQLAKFEKKGIIALNLDDLTPPGRVIYDRNGTAAKRFLTELNMSFVERHRYTLQRPVKEGKCDGFIISTTAAAVLAEEEQPFNLVTQTSLWHIKESTPGASERFMAFGRVYGQ
ncbi:hypothetical protein GOZ97_24370 [Agrobacterium vitis]|uniref:hypothetical protein n=1 Tax=Rhizobium/Agrobacterium group TaxID=227290 RepID=UPI0008DC07C4|nr:MULTISPECIES: hypothetical protein [Rhizobium/Agrobacterium group]MCF1436596.1 hypothetical protein [Allorhizobium ampelinum]MUO91883.1 hypothetical protein [Agrobacterium vitis]MUZ55327.1 hypothetical protein [Agrobacterium vitis]MUZ94552.1 hypothetical protein [Agrobacterium vitis]MVA42871.1 hypothetical protein [Agrobacterium vitis]